jgi:hypothetical protein
MIQHLELELGETSSEAPASDLPAYNPALDQNPKLTTNGNSKRADIRPDEFFSLTQGDAARAYLNKVGHAVTIEELVEGLKKGGCPVGGVDPARTLYIALIRNTKDFCKVPGGYIGLRSLYSGLKSGTAGTSAPKKKTKPKKGKLSAKGRKKSIKAGKKAPTNRAA